VCRNRASSGSKLIESLDMAQGALEPIGPRRLTRWGLVIGDFLLPRKVLVYRELVDLRWAPLHAGGRQFHGTQPAVVNARDRSGSKLIESLDMARPALSLCARWRRERATVELCNAQPFVECRAGPGSRTSLRRSLCVDRAA
jgi:hypothetical protein